MDEKHGVTSPSETSGKDHNHITTWVQFDSQVRYQDAPLLKRLDEFPDSVLVTGCQRSGTTMLARLITKSAGMVNYWFGPDDELDAALILSGYVDHQPRGRYCFQTTYINASFQEYFQHTNGHKIIFVLRNPFSVVYSLLHNFNRAALERLFLQCGADRLSGMEKWKYNILGPKWISRLLKGCLLYYSKVSQLYDLRKNLDSDQLITVEYDDLVLNRATHLPRIYSFINLPYKPEYSEGINSKSINKMENLTRSEYSTINRICVPLYNSLNRA